MDKVSSKLKIAHNFFKRKRVKREKPSQLKKDVHGLFPHTIYILPFINFYNIFSTFPFSPLLYSIYILSFINFYKYIQNISTGFLWFLLNSFYNIREQVHWIFYFLKRENIFFYLILKNCFIFNELSPSTGKLIEYFEEIQVNQGLKMGTRYIVLGRSGM